MMNVKDVVDRVFRDYLEPGDMQPVRTVTTSQISPSTNTIPYNPDLLPPEHRNLLGIGVLVEIGREQVIISDIDYSDNKITHAVRGANGTAPALHDAGSDIKIAPTFTRQSVFDAVGDTIVQLWPDLFQVQTTQVTKIGDRVFEIPSDAVHVTDCFILGRGPLGYQKTHFYVADFHPASSTNKAIFTNEPGEEAYVRYRAKFTRPDGEYNAFSHLGLEESWSRLIVVGATLHLITGRDADTLTQEFLTRVMGGEGEQRGANVQIARQLLQLYESLLHQARKSLRHQYPDTVEYSGVRI